MAESNSSKASDNNGNGWSWNSWLSAAKNKSTEVFEFVKKDLEEIGSAVKNEATCMVSNTTHALERTLKLNDSESTASSMKRTFSSFLGQMNTVLNPTPDDSDTEAVIITGDNETQPLTKLQQALYELQNNPGTYLKDPEQNLAAQYECWLEIINDQLTEDRLAKHLLSSEVLNQQYLALCPDQVSHDTFWKRYLFKKALLEDNMAHQEALEKRQKREQEMLSEDNLKWESEDFANNIDLTEEEQIKLLEQYENEFKTKYSKKNQNNDDNNKINNEKNLKNDEQNSLESSPIKTPSDVSLNSAETKSSSSSLDGEWECVTPDKI
ncbi:BSD domain-containing protein 1-like [Chrysoperla carnea]|uniref:BSD domain-containing protein 1-like n=1 Tax=Chrysoperla carnea TaxID=189513 RepID=UPI001D06A158|nr:BSD domain-containing protein 1-like [Chrysoperla carnea]